MLIVKLNWTALKLQHIPPVIKHVDNFQFIDYVPIETLVYKAFPS